MIKKEWLFLADYKPNNTKTMKDKTNKNEKFRLIWNLEDERKFYSINRRTKIPETWSYKEIKMVKNNWKDGALTADLELYSADYNSVIDFFEEKDLIKITGFEIEKISEPINSNYIR